MVGLLGAPLDFMWIRKVGGFGGPIPVTPDRIPAAGADPVRSFEGRFCLLNLEAGTTPPARRRRAAFSRSGRSARTWAAPFPTDPSFNFQGRKGWFRCPCHDSTYTKEGGVLVFGPAPRPMDVFPITVEGDGSLIVQTGRRIRRHRQPRKPQPRCASRAGEHHPAGGVSGAVSTFEHQQAGQRDNRPAHGRRARHAALLPVGRRTPDAAQSNARWTENAERGGFLFSRNCSSCHGLTGKGAIERAGLPGAPLNLEEYRPTAPGELLTLQNRFRDTIACGRVGTLMPAWSQEQGGPLNDFQIQQLVDAHNRHLPRRRTAGRPERDQRGRVAQRLRDR